MGGINAARGTYIIMGDADDSYDFLSIKPFVEKLRAGHDIVMGCRLPSGGGTVMPGAMPLLHQYFGNPFFSAVARWWFGVPIHDINCGMRGFTSSAASGACSRTASNVIASNGLASTGPSGNRLGINR